MGRQRGNFIQAFLPQSSFEKQQSQKRMRRNKQYTFLELRHPDRDRQAGRPSPTHRLYNPLQPLITWSPCLSHTPRMGAGVVRGGKPHLRSISPAIKPTKTRGKEGVRREEGLCIFLYLWQTAVLAWFKLPIEISYLNLFGIHKMPLGPPAQASSQPISLCSGWAAPPPPSPNI